MTVGALNHVVVGHDISVLTQDYARAKAARLFLLLPLLLAGLLLTRGAEEEVEERVAGVAAIALALACCGVAFDRYHTVDGAFSRFGEIGGGIAAVRRGHYPVARVACAAGGENRHCRKCCGDSNVMYRFHIIYEF